MPKPLNDLKAFALATGQRMSRAFAATVISLLVVNNKIGDVFALPAHTWLHVLGAGLGAALVSLLFCVAGAAQSGTGPSFGNVEVTNPPPGGTQKIA